jgi:hypothetical protein
VVPLAGQHRIVGRGGDRSPSELIMVWTLVTSPVGIGLLFTAKSNQPWRKSLNPADAEAKAESSFR